MPLFLGRSRSRSVTFRTVRTLALRVCRELAERCQTVLRPLAAGFGLAVSAAAPITYHERIAPILLNECAPCHRPGQPGPFPLLSFADARKHATDIVEVTARRQMPPWLPAPGEVAFLGERRLSEAQIETIRQWVAGGAVEGDPARTAPIPAWPQGDWHFGPPDLIVRMPAPYTVPAGGRDIYRHFILPMKLDRRRFVAAWEFRPRSRTVHHAFLRFDRTGEARRRDVLDPEPGFPGMDTPEGLNSPGGHFASWQPGAAPRRNRPGLVWALEPGADVVIQMHLQPQGKPEPLEAEIGFYFTDTPPTNEPVKVALNSYAIDIPAGSTNTVATDEYLLPADADLLGVLPHTHYLGRRIEVRALLPDKSEKVLLLIPEWDFRWQGDYQLREPLGLPAGTRVTMRVSFDNSPRNPFNPSSPPQRVQFGLNTTDEMAEAWLQLLPRNAAGSARYAESGRNRISRDVLAYNQQRLRINPKDGVAMVNLARGLLVQNRVPEARQQLQQAVEVAPDLAEAHYYLGIVHRMTGNRAAALAEFQRAVQLNPAHGKAHGNLGLLWVERNRLTEAAAEFEAALRVDGTDTLALGLLGAIRLQQGQVGPALTLLTKAAELDPDDADIKANLHLARQRQRTP